ncbi:MAG: adenylate/guanylate cyclase domain-containing protein, partial [Meiothermus silvanus]|nr:adenylate/guanylate cyclase domain-containing protein [Allomeiothermus silvanus]
MRGEAQVRADIVVEVEAVGVAALVAQDGVVDRGVTGSAARRIGPARYEALGGLEAELSRLRPLWAQAGLPEIHIGVGLSTGPMSVGNMGSRKRFDYTVIGDAVNLGARLESANKLYGSGILLSEATWRALLQLAGLALPAATDDRPAMLAVCELH